MEALVIALAIVAIILIVLWLVRWYQRRRANGSSGGTKAAVPVVVVVDIPHGQRASLVTALEKRLDDTIRLGNGAHRSMVPPPSANAPGRDQIVINATNGARTLDTVLSELRGRGFRVEATEGRTISLSGWAGAVATVLVRSVGRDAG